MRSSTRGSVSANWNFPCREVKGERLTDVPKGNTIFDRFWLPCMALIIVSVGGAGAQMSLKGSIYGSVVMRFVLCSAQQDRT